MIDIIVLGILLFFFISGFIKGIVSQIATIAGLVLAFMLAKPLGAKMSMVFERVLGTQEGANAVIAPLVTGLLIYFLVVLLGKLFEKELLRKVAGLKTLDRMGGGLLSVVKGGVLIMIVFFLIHFIPSNFISTVAPKLSESQSYQFSQKHNPLGTEDAMQRFKKYRAKKKQDKEALGQEQSMDEVIGDYLIDQALETDTGKE